MRRRFIAFAAVLLLALPAGVYARPPAAAQVLVPAGKYIRGTDFWPDKAVEITLKAYRIDQDEVTNAHYAECVKSKVCVQAKVAGQPAEPVRGVSWTDAAGYCKFVNRRLPTDAEWERAAFPPDKNQSECGPLGAEGRDLCKVLIIGGRDKKSCAQKHRGPEEIIAQTLAEQGADLRFYDAVPITEDGPPVYDLLGNVAEWVADWLPGPSEPLFYYSRPTVTVNPTGPKSGTFRVIRGGSFAAKTGICQAERRFELPAARLADVGFRCAADVDDPTSGASQSSPSRP